MSDTATIETAGAPAVAEPQAPAPAQPQGQETGGDQTQPKSFSRRDVRATVRDAARAHLPGQQDGGEGATAEGATEEQAGPKVDAHGRKHSPDDGKYLPEHGEEAVPADSDDDDADLAMAEPGEAPAEGSQATPEVEVADDDAAEAAKAFSVEIPKDHPLAQQGRDAISVASQQDAEQVRALINGTYARRQEVEFLTSERDELRDKYRELQRKVVEIESRDVAQKAWMKTPEYQAAVKEYHEIKEAIGQEAASRYWAGRQGELKQLVEQEQSQRMERVEAEEAERVGRQFATQAWGRIQRLPEAIREIPQVKDWFEEELQLFNQRAENGHYNHLSSWDDLHKEFATRFAMRIRSEPTAIEAMTKAKGKTTPANTATKEQPVLDRKKIEQEAIEKYKRELAAKRQANPTNPLNSIPGATDAGARPSAGVGQEQEPNLGHMSAGDRKRHFRQTARQAVRRNLGT